MRMVYSPNRIIYSHYSIQSPTTAKLVKALGAPRTPGTPFDLSDQASPELREMNQHFADIAASAQLPRSHHASPCKVCHFDM